jgi:hypothetical protein
MKEKFDKNSGNGIMFVAFGFVLLVSALLILLKMN